MLAFKAHAKQIYAVAFSADGRWVATSGRDEVARVWSFYPAKQIAEFPGHAYYAPLAWSPQGKYLAIGGRNLALYQPAASEAQESPKRLLLFEQKASTVCISPDGATLIAQAQDVPLRRWEIPSGKVLPGGWGGTRNSEPSEFPTGLAAFQPHTGVLATLFGVLGKRGYDSVFYLWSPKGERVATLHAEFGWAHPISVSFSPDGSLLAAGYGPRLAVWDVAAGKVLATCQPSKKHFKGVCFTPDGERVATIGGDATVQYWNARTCQEAGGLDLKIGKLVVLAAEPAGGRMAAGSMTGKVAIWDAVALFLAAVGANLPLLVTLATAPLDSFF